MRLGIKPRALHLLRKLMSTFLQGEQDLIIQLGHYLLSTVFIDRHEKKLDSFLSVLGIDSRSL